MADLTNSPGPDGQTPSGPEELDEDLAGRGPARRADAVAPGPLVALLHLSQGGDHLPAAVAEPDDAGAPVAGIGDHLDVAAVLERLQRLGEGLLGQAAELDHAGRPDALVGDEAEQPVVPRAQARVAGAAELVQARAQLPQGALEERREDRGIPLDTIGQAA